MNEHIDDLELDRRLAEELAALHADLDRLLDLDAGLTDATLPGRVHAYAEDLDRVLDLDTGLAAILPTVQAPGTATRGDSGIEPVTARPREQAALLRFARTLALMPAADRLHVRLWLPRPALATICLLVTIGRQTREDLLARAGSLDRALAHTCDLAHALAHALTSDSDLAHAHALALDLALALDHTRDRDLDLDLDLDLDRALDRALDLTRALARDLDRARDLTRALARALDLTRAHARDLARTLDLALDLDRDLDLDLTHALDRALDHANSTAGTASTTEFEFRLAVAADQAAVDLHEEDLLEAVRIMKQVVSDVVGADLGDADLTGIPLGGVRWSSTTRWPPVWQDLVRRNSVWIGPDLWEINHGGVGTDHLVTMT